MNHSKKKSKKINKTRKYKKLVCNPNVHGRTIKKNSCFTSEVLYNLRDSYNLHHPTDKIMQKDKKSIWNSFQKKMPTCSREDCWFSTIQDQHIRRKLFQMTFAPKQPTEWKKSPSSWLSNNDILNVLKQYEKAYANFRFIGPTPIDFDSKPVDSDSVCVWKDLCTFQLSNFVDKDIRKIGIVFNLDRHDQPGSHWTSLFIDLDDKIIFYMDSVGDTIPAEINKLVQRITRQGLELFTPIQFVYYENHPFAHQYGNNECGMYSLYFIITMLLNKTDRRKFKTLKSKVNYFKKHRISDKYVFSYRKKYFNI